MELNKEQVEILKHTDHGAAHGLYCGDSPDMQGLITAGLMKSAGRKSFVPDEYFRMTEKGQDMLGNLPNDGGHLLDESAANRQ